MPIDLVMMAVIGVFVSLYQRAKKPTKDGDD